MEHKVIGNTGVQLPPVIFGTSALGNLYASIPDATKTAIIEQCLLHVPQPVVFDSAGKYGAGMALEKLGEIFSLLKVKHSDIIISNKLGWLQTPLLTPEPLFEKGVWKELKHDAKQNISYEGIMACWEQGNALLKNYIPQMVSVHDPDEYLNMATDEVEFKLHFSHILDAYKALAELKNSGKAKAVGVGAKNWKTIHLIAKEVDLDWVMFANSMTIFHHPRELLDFMSELHAKGTAIINSAVFHAGFLTGGNFFDYVKIKPDTESNKDKFRWREEFWSLCKKFGVIPAHACVKFATTHPGVISISLNTSNPERIKDNVASVRAVIPAEFWHEMKRLNLIDPEYPYLNY